MIDNIARDDSDFDVIHSYKLALLAYTSYINTCISIKLYNLLFHTFAAPIPVKLMK